MEMPALAFMGGMEFSRMEKVEDYGISDVDYHSTDDVKNNAVITRKALQIVRAKIGDTELRLLSEMSDGKHQQFIVETVNVAPFTSTRVALITPRSKKPMIESEAVSAFEKTVSQKYPPAVMKNGKSLPTFTRIY